MAAPSASVLRHLSRAALISAVAIAAFCDAQAQVLAPPVVTVVAGVKQIELSWPVVAGASYYVVKESPSLGAPFTAISPQLPQGKPWEPMKFTKAITVHGVDWLQARYIVEACDGSRIPLCSKSIGQGVAALELDAIGYLRAWKADADDAFGFSVATSNDGKVVAIGAPYEDCSCVGVNPSSYDEAATNAGAVFVFVKGANDWQRHAYIKADAVAPYDLFGMTLALSDDGNALAVGAPAANPNTPAVYVFTRFKDTWRQTARLVAANAELGDNFATALAISGDGNTIAVGATGEDSSGTGAFASSLDNDEPESGAVYIFSRAADGTWSQSAFIKGSHSDRADLFGTSVALSTDGRTLAVGSLLDDSDDAGQHVPALSCVAPAVGTACDAGAVDIYLRDFVGNWTHGAYLRPSVVDSEDWFGSSVALSADGTRLAVGAVGEDSAAIGVDADALDDSAPESGAVYLFNGTKSTWVQEAFVKASDVDAEDYFGATVDLDSQGRVLAVSARMEDGSAAGVSGTPNENLTNAGAVFLFGRSSIGDRWTQNRYIKAPNPGADDHFGGSFARGALALSGDATTLVVPAADEDGENDATPNAGAVYLY